MPKRYILSSPDIPNQITGEPGAKALVHGKADLRRREKAAKKAGVRVNVRRVKG